MNLVRKIFKKFYYYVNFRKFNPIIDFSCINKILFTAHPDDEFIFLGNRLIMEKDWLVVCMTNGDSRIRSKEFVNLMNELNLQYKILNFKDGLDEKWNENNVKKIVNDIILSKKHWHLVVTHNEEGEYGHFQHKQLNKIVTEACFGNHVSVFCTKDKLYNDTNKLSYEDSQIKFNLAMKHYRSQIDVIKGLSDYFEYEGIDKTDSLN